MSLLTDVREVEHDSVEEDFTLSQLLMLPDAGSIDIEMNRSTTLSQQIYYLWDFGIFLRTDCFRVVRSCVEEGGCYVERRGME